MGGRDGEGEAVTFASELYCNPERKKPSTNKGTSKTSFLVRSNQPVWLSGSWVGSHPQSDVETFWLLWAFRISDFGSFRLI